MNRENSSILTVPPDHGGDDDEGDVAGPTQEPQALDTNITRGKTSQAFVSFASEILGLLTLSFAPFRRSGRVTHATMI